MRYDFAFVRVKFNEIHPDPANPRGHRDPEADATLNRLIELHGCVDAIWIRKDEEGRFLILDGHRRYDALVERGYKDTNPTVTCSLLFPLDDPDRPLTEEEVTTWLILRERGKEKWPEFSFYLKAVQHADSQKEKGRPYFQIAREDFDWSPQHLSSIKSVLEDPILSDFLMRASISVREAILLINLPAEIQIALVDAKEDLSAKELREVVKLARNGTSVPSAIESVKHPQLTDDAQESLSEGTLSELQVDEGGDHPQDDSGKTSGTPPETPDIQVEGADVASGSPPGQMDDPHAPAPKTPSIMERAFEGPPEREARTESQRGEDPADPESVDESPLETKKSEPAPCIRVEKMESELQKLVQKRPETFLGSFHTESHKRKFLSKSEGVHAWSGELCDLFNSHLNGSTPTMCEVIRKFNAVKEIMQRHEVMITANDRPLFDERVKELKSMMSRR